MTIHFFVRQKHTKNGAEQLKKIDIQNWKEIHTGDKLSIYDHHYQVEKIQNTVKPLVLHAICVEVSHPGNPALLSFLQM